MHLAGSVAARLGGTRHWEEFTDGERRAAAFTALDVVSHLARIPVNRLARNADRGLDHTGRIPAASQGP